MLRFQLPACAGHLQGETGQRARVLSCCGDWNEGAVEQRHVSPEASGQRHAADGGVLRRQEMRVMAALLAQERLTVFCIFCAFSFLFLKKMLLWPPSVSRMCVYSRTLPSPLAWQWSAASLGPTGSPGLPGGGLGALHRSSSCAFISLRAGGASRDEGRV